MDKMRQLFRRYEQESDCRYWIGARPDVANDRLILAILEMIDYPKCREPFQIGFLSKKDWTSAARILAFSGNYSLVDVSERPSDTEQKEALEAIRELDGTAQFFSNGDWGLSTPSMGWNPVSRATFDAGVLGYDSASAFVFWVEDED